MMKNSMAIAFVLIAAFTVSAQERPIDKTAFEAALSGTSDHAAAWAGKAYRMTVTTSAKMSTRPDLDHAAKIVTEYGPGGHRTIYSSSFAGKSTATETLTVGESVFRRSNGGAWTVSAKVASDDSTAPPAPKGDAFETVTSEIQYFSLGNEPFRGGTAAVYKKIERSTKVHKTSGTTLDSVITRKYWILDGIQVKDELISTGKAPTYNSNNSITMEWQLDPSIIFRAPIQ